MAEDSGQSVLPALLDHILPLVPGLVEKLKQGIEVLDVGCGRGLALMLMAQTFPNSRFIGYDFSENGVAAAQADADQKGLINRRFEEKTQPPLTE
jgi:cyclopropane fatty-acyl-phospholipid synthase-like methyltransferase